MNYTVWRRGVLLGLSICSLVAAGTLSAQEPAFHAGVALVRTRYDELTGAGPAVVAARRLAVRQRLSIAADVRLQRLSLDGAPQSCALVEQIYCLGREDRLGSVSAGVALILDADATAENGAYAIPLHVGLHHVRATSTEWQGPTLLCIANGQVVSCPDNPPFERRQDTWRATGIAIAVGMGLRFHLSPLSVRLESRIVSTPGPTRGLSGELAVLFGRRRISN